MRLFLLALISFVFVGDLALAAPGECVLTLKKWTTAGFLIGPDVIPRKDFDEVGSVQVGECSAVLALNQSDAKTGRKSYAVFTLSRASIQNGEATCVYSKGPEPSQNGIYVLECTQTVVNLP